MALFKKFSVTKKAARFSSGETNTGLVINPSDGDIWIDSQPYDSNTLYPLFDKSCVALKNNKVYEETVSGFVTSPIVAKGPCLINGQNTGSSMVDPLGSYGLGNRDHNLEDDKTLSMSSNLFRFTSSGGTNFSLLTLPYGSGTYYPPIQKYIFIEGNNFSNPESVTHGAFVLSSNTYHSQQFPIYVDTSLKYIYFVSYKSYAHASYYYRSLSKVVSRSSYTTNEDDGTLSIADSIVILEKNDGSSVSGGYKDLEVNNFYYCGKNSDNTLMFLETVETDSSFAQQTSAFEDRSSKVFNVESYNVGTGTVSTISSISNSGFTTAAAATKLMLRPRPAQFIDSPISGETNVCYSYYPVANDSFEISFVKISWDKSGNSNAGTMVADNCTMTYSSGTVTDYLTYPAKSTTANIGCQTKSNSFITLSGGDYYLHYLPSYSSPSSVALQNATSKNLVSYQIDSTNFSNLTYHSSIQVNACDFVHLNSARTKIAVIEPGTLKIYNWNNGWNETAPESGDFIGVTQDDSGRIIGLSGIADNNTATANSLDANFAFIEHKVHLISDSLPNTVTVNFASSSITYSGSNLSTSVNVSTFNDSSARIAKSVDLKIDGVNAQFTSNSSTSINVTSLTSGELNVPITVTGPGPLSISASFAL